MYVQHTAVDGEICLPYRSFTLPPEMMGKILFAVFDDFSHINNAVHQQMTRCFPEHVIHTLVIKDKLKKNIPVLIGAVMAVFIEYGSDFIRGSKRLMSWRNQLYRTHFILKYFNRLLTKELSSDSYEFILQTQSLFRNTGTAVPTFIYTDHTNLNNLKYPDINPWEYLGTNAYRQAEKQVYENARMVFVMSGNIRQSLLRQYGLPDQQVRMIGAGSNTGVSDSNPAKYRSQKILFVGKDWERKGGPLLLTAFEKVLQEIPSAQLVIIGCRPKTNLPNCVILGEVGLDQVRAAYEDAAVFCMPTRREPFGLVFVEAMSRRLPIVASNIGALPELVENGRNGYSLPADPHQYAEKLIHLLRHPEIAENYGNYAAEKVTATYNWHRVGDGIAAGIRETLKGQHGNGIG